MNKVKSFIEKCRCSFIGWDYNILSQCGEYSHRLLKIYSSAILIPMAIWFVIGFVFSQRYIGTSSILGRLAIATAFATLVFLIERIIILHIGSKGILVFRGFLAIVMSILGAFIFDQLIFRNDLENAIFEHQRDKTKLETNLTIAENKSTRDSLSAVIDSLYVIYNAKPTVPISRPVPGTTYYDSITHSTHISYTYVNERIPNPVLTQIQSNEAYRSILDTNIFILQTLNFDSIAHAAIQFKKTGFLEELKASVSVIFGSWISGVFYGLLTFFLLFLELIVVSLKFFNSKKSEYDLIVLHQLDTTSTRLKNTQRKLSEQFISNTLNT